MQSIINGLSYQFEIDDKRRVNVFGNPQDELHVPGLKQDSEKRFEANYLLMERYVVIFPLRLLDTDLWLSYSKYYEQIFGGIFERVGKLLERILGEAFSKANPIQASRFVRQHFQPLIESVTEVFSDWRFWRVTIFKDFSSSETGQLCQRQKPSLQNWPPVHRPRWKVSWPQNNLISMKLTEQVPRPSHPVQYFVGKTRNWVAPNVLFKWALAFWPTWNLMRITQVTSMPLNFFFKDFRGKKCVATIRYFLVKVC